MKPLIRFVLFAALVGIFAHDGQAQPVPQFRAFAGNPTGYCGGPLSFAVDSTTGNWWTCDNHVYVQPASGGGPPTGAAGGDLSGTYPNPTVAGLEAVPFCTGFTPTNGQAIEYTTASSPNPCWTVVTPGPTTNQNLRTISGVLTPSNLTACGYVSYAGTINGFHSNTVDGATASTVLIKVEMQATRATFLSTGVSGASDISNGGEQLTSVLGKDDTTLTSWTTSLAAGATVCLVASGFTLGSAVSVEVNLAAN